MSERKAFNFFRSYWTVYKELNDKDKVKFMDALLERQFEGKEPNLSGMSLFAYLSQQHSIDSQVLGYEHKTGTKLGGSVGGREGASAQEEGQEEGQGEEQVETPPTPSRGKFTPPTLEEVEAYCKERDRGVNPSKWFDFYTSKGWMVGKNKMKDWKAAVRTWEEEKPKGMTPEEAFRLSGLNPDGTPKL